MTLADLCRPFPELRLEGRTDTPIKAVVEDSRACGPGSLFVAVQGRAADGHAFVPAAVAAGCGAVAVAATRRPGCDLAVAGGRPPAVLVAERTDGLAARLARELSGRPDAELLVAGATGTNGKTTVTFLLRHLLERLVGPCGLLGTVRYEFGQRSQVAPLTTPGGPALYEFLANVRDGGGRAVAMEISSHALDQGRVEDLALDVAILTNLGRDHLDYHADLTDYLAAKAGILELLRPAARRGKPPGVAVINAADPAFAGLDTTGLRVVRYAARPPAVDRQRIDLRVTDSRLSMSGAEVILECASGRYRVASPLVGRFNVENLAAVMAVALAGDWPLASCADILATAGQVPGRMECFPLPNGATAVVDYAHTPDALAAVLAACDELTAGRILLVFGCGGDRDRGKRPLMGKAAASGADQVWITSDNPRSEDPAAICAQVERGYLQAAQPRAGAHRLICDRSTAIREALAEAESADMVVIAGKGHEDYQLVGGQRLAFDDRRIVRDWIGEAAHA